MATPFSSRFRHFFQKMTDDKHMNPDDQPLTDNAAEHTAGEQDTTTDAATPEAGASQGASRTEAELADLKDKYLRLAAEFENYKRRTAKERTDLFKTANQELMVALLPVIDDFDRARQHTQGATDPAALQNALDITYNKLTKTLENKGLTPITPRVATSTPNCTRPLLKFRRRATICAVRLLRRLKKAIILAIRLFATLK